MGRFEVASALAEARGALRTIKELDKVQEENKTLKRKLSEAESAKDDMVNAWHRFMSAPIGMMRGGPFPRY